MPEPGPNLASLTHTRLVVLRDTNGFDFDYPSHSYSKIGTDVRTPKRKHEFVRESTSYHPILHFAPICHILGQQVLKIDANINNPISALNAREATKFSRYRRNRVEEHDVDVRR